MRRIVGALVVVACGPKAPPAEPLENLEALPKPERGSTKPGFALARRPVIDVSGLLPDFHDELRWPLSGMTHPALEPRFAIAQQLATAGIGWEELCARGVHNRVSATQKELLTYLRGWCFVAKRDVDNACAQLYPLIGSTTSGLTPAVRLDLANILVEQGDADKAEHWLTKHNIRDIQVLDLLAANYVEVGSTQDAFTINQRAIDSDDYATDATKCRRLVRRIVLGGEASSTFALESLRQLATAKKPKIPDPLCERLYHKVACWRRPATDCMPYFTDDKIDPRALVLLETYHFWPYEADFVTWGEHALTALRALPLPGTAELVITAFEASLRAEPRCTGNRAAIVHYSVEMIRHDPSHAPYEPRLEQLAKACPKLAPPPAPSPPSAPPANALPPQSNAPPSPSSAQPPQANAPPSPSSAHPPQANAPPSPSSAHPPQSNALSSAHPPQSNAPHPRTAKRTPPTRQPRTHSMNRPPTRPCASDIAT